MPVIDDARHWVRDRLVNDPLVKQSPGRAVDELQQAMPALSPKERDTEIQRVKAYATYYHEGHHREKVPEELRSRLDGLTKDAERLKRVDDAREVLRDLGGPPSPATIARALERTHEGREEAQERVQTLKQSQHRSRSKGADQGIGV